MPTQADVLNVLDRVNDSVIAFDKEGNITYVNKAFSDVLGLETSQMVGKNIWKLRPQLLESVIYEKVNEAIEKKEIRIVEWKSSYTDSFWESKIFPSDEGVVAIGRDITERKKAQEYLTTANEKLQGILNAIEEGISLVGLDGRVLDCNEASLKLLGLSRDEFVGMNVYDVIVPEDRQLAIDGSVKVLETGRIVNEVGVLRKNGEVFCGEISVVMLRDKNANPVGFVGVTRDITERKKIEAEVKESEELYRTLFENSDDGFMLVEPIYNEREDACDIRFLKFNAAYERQTGAKSADAIGRKASDAVPELERTIIYLSGKVAKTGKSTHSEAYDKYSNKWYDSHYIPFSKGQVGILFRDITQHKKAENNLKDKEEELGCILDSSPTIIFYKDIQGKFIQANKAFAQALNVTKEDLLGKTVFDLYSPEIAQQMTNDDIVVMKTKKPKLGTVESYESPTGMGWIRTDKIPSLDENGNVDGIIGFSEEITERRKAEDALKQTQKKYQDLIETTSDFIWEIDCSGRYTYCSPQIEKLFGVKPMEIIGKTPFDMTPPSEMEMGLTAFKKIVEALQPFYGLQTTACDSKGRLIFVETNGVPFFDDKGKLLGFRGISRDITERKTLEKQLQDNERMAAIGQTAGMIGHDIRNPLQAIISELYLAKEDIAQAPDGRHKQESLESVNFVEEQVNYINKIVSDLQDFARPLNPEFVIVNLTDLIVGVFDTIVLPDKIKLGVDVKDNLKFKTDPTFIKRSITNLVNNAIQAMPDGGELGLSAQKKEECIVICVSDSGHGIPEHVKANLFKPLTTTKSKGQGLGLAVVKRLIEALNGKVSFESEEGKGTKFIIELPANQ